MNEADATFTLSDSELTTNIYLQVSKCYSSVTKTVATAMDMQWKQAHILLPVPIATVTEYQRWQRP